MRVAGKLNGRLIPGAARGGGETRSGVNKNAFLFGGGRIAFIFSVRVTSNTYLPKIPQSSTGPKTSGKKIILMPSIGRVSLLTV